MGEAIDVVTPPLYEVAGWESHPGQADSRNRQHAATVTWRSENGRGETLQAACSGGIITAAIRTADGQDVPFHPGLPWACRQCVRLLEAGAIQVPPPLEREGPPPAGMNQATWTRYLAASATAPEMFAALTNLVVALDPQPDEGSTCWACRSEDAEYDEPHSPDCAYMLARRMIGRGPVEDGGSALVGDPGERAGGVE